MASTYPTTQDDFSTLECGSTVLPKDRVNDIGDAVESLEDKVGITGDTDQNSHTYKLSEVTGADKAVGKTATQTLTNKTLTAPSINSPQINEAVTMTASSTELNYNDGVTVGTAVASKTVVLDANKDFNFGTGDVTATIGAFTAVNSNFPTGFMANGKIVVSVSTNNLTVSIKTAAGTDPSSTDPVTVTIAGTKYVITAAVTMTKNAGANYGLAGSGEFDGRNVNWFVYLIVTGGAIGIGAARFAKHNAIYSDFSSTAANYRHIMVSGTPSASDPCIVIDRFTAQLSASASFNWSISGTGGVVGRPVYSTDKLQFDPVMSTNGTAFTNAPTVNGAFYKLDEERVTWLVDYTYAGTSGGTAATKVSTGIVPTNSYPGFGGRSDGNTLNLQWYNGDGVIYVTKYDSTTAIANSNTVQLGIVGFWQ